MTEMDFQPGAARRRLSAEIALDSERLIEFLTRLIKQAGGRKIYRILDKLHVHHSAPVKAWLAQNTGEITICPATVPS